MSARRGAVLLLALGFGSGVAPVRAADPVNLYAIFPVTGFAAFVGQSDRAAVLALEAAVNKTGGIGGRPLHFTVYDDQSDASTALQLANGIAARNGPAMVGPILSGACNAVAPTLSKTTGPVMFCISGAVKTEGNPFAYGGGTGYDYAKATLNYIRGRGWNRIGLLTSTDATGQEAERSIQALLATPDYAKLSLVANEHFAVGDMTVASQLSRVKSAGVQIVVVWTTGTGLGTALRGLKDLGMDQLPVVTAPGNATSALMKQFNAYMPKELYVSSYDSLVPEQVTDRAVRARLNEWRDRMIAFGATADPLSIAGYDYALLLVEALKHVGPDGTAAQMNAWISAQSHYVGAIGVYNFQRAPNHGLDYTTLYMVRWDPAREAFVGASKAGGFP